MKRCILAWFTSQAAWTQHEGCPITTSHSFAVGWAFSVQEEFLTAAWVPWPVGRVRLSSDHIELWIPAPLSILGRPLRIPASEITSYAVERRVLDFVKLDVAGPVHRVTFACSRRHASVVQAWLATHNWPLP